MAKNELEGSQQQGQGVTLGTQGNNDMIIPGSAPHGPNNPKEGPDDRHIPNQEKSSATSHRNSEGGSEE